MTTPRIECPTCEADERPGVDRRTFLARAGATAAALVIGPDWLPAVADELKAAPDTLAKELYVAIGAQRLGAVHPPHSPIAREVHANWDVSPVRIRSLELPHQALVREIIRSATTDEGYQRFRRQMRDDSGGIHNYSLAFVGQPESQKFQLVIAGRHFTLRIDGRADDKIAFGGPILYGHSEERRAEHNLFHDHTRRANAMYTMLDERQRARALVQTRHPDEGNVHVRPDNLREGIGVGELTAEQQAIIAATIRELLAQYGDKAVAEMTDIVTANGGWTTQRLAFYAGPDWHHDGLWDVWRLEGPGFLYYYRGMPHVHAYVNIFRV